MNDSHAVPRPAMIPVARPSLTQREFAAVEETMKSNWLGPGPREAELEDAFAAAVGAAHGVSTNSGTAALAASKAVLGAGPGDEVILPSFTFMSAFQVIRATGSHVFADIEPGHLTLDPADVERRVTAQTRGIVAVHHGGHAADTRRLQAIAARAGGCWKTGRTPSAPGTKREIPAAGGAGRRVSVLDR